MKFLSGAQISPCIISKVKKALGLPTSYRWNEKTCSPDYWELTCRTVGVEYACSRTTIEKAIRRYSEFARKWFARGDHRDHAKQPIVKDWHIKAIGKYLCQTCEENSILLSCCAACHNICLLATFSEDHRIFSYISHAAYPNIYHCALYNQFFTSKVINCTK